MNLVPARPARALAAGIVLLAVVALAAARYARGDVSDTVTTARVTRGHLTARLTTTGTLRPVDSFTYHSPVPGRDVEILELAPEGSRVQAGDVLVRLDASDVDRELVRARDDQRQAQIDLDVAEGEWDEAQAKVTAATAGDGALAVDEATVRLQLAERRAARLEQEYTQLQPLLAKGFITREELGRTASDYEQAQEELALARKRADVVTQISHPREQKKAALTLAQKDSQRLRARARVVETGQRLAQLGEILDACLIRAKGPGLVVYEEFLSANPRRKIRVGDRVTSSQGLVTIPEVDRMLLDTSVTEADVHRVHEGQRAVVHVEAFPGVAMQGVVSRVGTVAATSIFSPQQDKRFAVVIALSPVDAALRPDMSARADVLVSERPDALLVPVNAVFEEHGAYVARRIGDHGVETRAVTLGETDDHLVEVLSGLDDGDRVLLVSAETTPATPTSSPVGHDRAAR